MKICITGATGFIGKALCQKLIERNDVLAIVRNLNNSALKKDKKLKLIEINDINENTDLKSHFKGVDCLIHCAAKAHSMKKVTPKEIKDYQDYNVNLTYNLAEQAALANIKRIIFISSVKVNGEETRINSKFNHDDDPLPKDPYGLSKLEAEKILRKISARYNKIEFCIIRPPLVYGPGVKGNFLNLLKLISKGLPLPLGKINNLRSLIGLDNLVDLIICCISHPKARNQVFLASDCEDISTTDLINKLSKHMNKSIINFPLPVFLIRLAGKFFNKSSEVEKLVGFLRLDASHTRNTLGWAPPYNLDYGLSQTVNWFLKKNND